MIILVAVKRVIDPYVKIRINPSQSGVELQNVKMAMNPFDEIAVEEALRLRDEQIASEVVLVSIGTANAQETLRHGLALGADRALLVETEDDLTSLQIAKILEVITKEEKPSLVLLGKQSIDGDNNQTPQMLAARLGWPQATYISKLSVKANGIEVTREIDGGLEQLALQLPAVVSTDLRLNKPRYASLPNIMKAKQKPLKVIPLATLGLTLPSRINVLKVGYPSVRQAGVKVQTPEELLSKLQHDNVL